MAEETKKSKQEIVKEASNFLRGTIAEDLARDPQRFGSDDAGLLKFHGTYQQDDRNARKHRKPGDDKGRRKIHDPRRWPIVGQSPQCHLQGHGPAARGRPGIGAFANC